LREVARARREVLVDREVGRTVAASVLAVAPGAAVVVDRGGGVVCQRRRREQQREQECAHQKARSKPRKMLFRQAPNGFVPPGVRLTLSRAATLISAGAGTFARLSPSKM